jgi:hypothetical protein
MRRIVISQPMYFPWLGMMEQIRLSDVYVHLDDVQFSKGSFTNRVQIKTAKGTQWMTIPLEGLHLGQRIMDLRTRETEPWRRKHLDLLEHAFAGAPFAEDARALCRSVLEQPTDRLCELAIASLQALCDYFEIGPRPLLERSSSLGIEGRGWERVLAIVSHLGGDVYVSGLGGRNYISHEAFDHAGVRIEYMRYLKTQYPQLHGAFRPFVSALDLVANMGRAGRTLISSSAVYWKESSDE